MKINKLTIEMMVKDVKKTVDYYVSTLGFTLTNHVGDSPIIWAQINFGEIAIMMMEEKALSEDIADFKGKTIGGSVVLFIEMEGIEEFYENVKDKAEIVQEFHTTNYGTMEFAMKDVNGYVLGLAERVK
jgi:uncharacterized glyoxalase superfamily protein PhnB